MNFLFYLFSSFTLISGVMVIRAKNPVHSVLFLILVFFNSAGLLIMLGLDFFGMIFLVVYVGAIAVLFLFVVMMLNIRVTEIHEKKLRYLPLGVFLGILFLLEIFVVVDNDLVPLLAWSKDPSITLYLTPWPALGQQVTNISALGGILYTYYFFYFCLAGCILLVAMMGAIVLTITDDNRGLVQKKQEVWKQNTREFVKTVDKIA